MSEITNWQDAYKQFQNIIDEVADNVKDRGVMFEHLIESKVDKLYKKHEGDPNWDLAYKKWRNAE